MVKGFFAKSTLAKSKPPAPTTARCGACGLFKRCRSPKLPMVGDGAAGVLVVGDKPLDSEDDFGALTGGLLGKHLSNLGLNMLKDCWYTTATVCHQKGKPEPAQVDHCRPFLKATIRKTKPTVIILVGQAALRAVLGWTWRPDPGSLKQWAGQQIPCRTLNAWVCPTYDPKFIEDENHPCLNRYFERHLEEAIDLAAGGVPWPDGAPAYREQVKCVYEPKRAADILRGMQKAGGPIAFDYEGTSLKPEFPDARLVSAAVCWRGVRTVAFPWVGEAIKAFSDLLKSPCPKIAANMMFEDRWTRRMLGHGVNNWVFDTMQAAHLIDNQPGVCSVAYQSHALLGVPDHEHHIKPFLKSAAGTRVNRIHEIELGDLLLYNGLDAVQEFWIAEKQMAKIGITPPEGFYYE